MTELEKLEAGLESAKLRMTYPRRSKSRQNMKNHRRGFRMSLMRK